MNGRILIRSNQAMHTYILSYEAYSSSVLRDELMTVRLDISIDLNIISLPFLFFDHGYATYYH